MASTLGTFLLVLTLQLVTYLLPILTLLTMYLVAKHTLAALWTLLLIQTLTTLNNKLVIN
jgi:hypothetical protein